MAKLHRAGRVLPERPPADWGRPVTARLATLDSCSDGFWNAGAGTGACVDDVSAEALANLVFSYHYALADWHHPFGELHVLELPGAGSGVFAARRPILVALLSGISEERSE